MEVGAHNLAKSLIDLGHEPIVITSYSIYRNLKKKNYFFLIRLHFFPRMFYCFAKK